MAREVAADIGVDPALLYRLLRAQASIGLLVEDASGGFRLTESGDLLRSAHPQSLAPMARLEEGPRSRISTSSAGSGTGSRGRMGIGWPLIGRHCSRGRCATIPPLATR